jgi:predicted Zn-dependent peptidase
VQACIRNKPSKEQIQNILRIILEEVKNTALYELDPKLLQWVKDQTKYSLLKEFSNPRKMIHLLGNGLMLHDRFVHPHELIRRIESTTSEDLCLVAEEYLYDLDFSVFCVGDVKDFPKYQDLRFMCFEAQEKKPIDN